MHRLRALAPWLLALLALAWALAPHVSRDSLLALAPWLLALLALALIVALSLRWRRRPRLPRPTPPPDHRHLLARALRTARSARPTQIWLCLGLPGHGKTTLLAAAGPHQRLADLPQLHLLDTTRELLVEHPGGACELPLQLARPRQPLDAVLLVLRLPDLLTANLTALATTLRSQLATLAPLAVEVPLIVVCTHLDRLAGHRELVADDRSPWGFELRHANELADHLRAWSTWVSAERLTRIANNPDPSSRARLHTLGAEFSRACDRLLALCELLLPTTPSVHLRAVHFTALKPTTHPPTDALLTTHPPTAHPPADALLTDLAAALHLRLRPQPTPHATATLTDPAPIFTAVRRLAREATRTPPIVRAAARRRHLLAAGLTLVTATLALAARDAARSTHDRLQSVADLTATLATPDPIAPLLTLRRELELWPATATARDPFTPALHPALRDAFRRLVHARLLAPIVRDLELALPTHASHDQLRAYLLLTTAEPVPGDMSLAPGPFDPVQKDWLLAELPRLATTSPTHAADLALLLTTFFTHATPDDLRFPRDHAAVERARARLRADDDDDTLVQAALTAVDATCEPLTLPALTHARRLVSARALPCSFTRDAWPRVHAQLLRAAEHRDAWVLARPASPKQAAHTDHERLTRLRGRYEALYIAAWTDFLAGLRVRRPADQDDAARLLAELTGDERPLTRIFTALEHHTRGLAAPQLDRAVLTHLLQGSDHPALSAAIVRAFAPLLSFAIGTQGRQSGLDRYHARLAELQLALDAARRDPAELPALQTQLAIALADTHALLQHADLRRFRPLLQTLLLPPLDALQAALRDRGKLALSAAYCAEIDAPLRHLVARYPFTRDARDELGLAEFTAFFHPDTGTLRRFRDAQLAPLLEIHGDEFSARPTPHNDDHPISPAVLTLLARAARLGALAFPTGELGLDLDLDLHCNADIGRVTLSIDGATHSYSCGPDHHTRMRWPGPTRTPGATLELLGRDGRRETIPGNGPWGLWRLLEKDGLVLPPRDHTSPRLVFRFDLHASRLGALDLAVTAPRTRNATLLFGDPTHDPRPPLLAPLRDPATTTPPTSLFTGLPACNDLTP
ncbi:MAG: hypothetical protein IPO88_07910 [Nannocystis sp.]|uniref:ImcF-related family protein n=1 Tax=Nannocystis sp. TaxID=1962667 RepID=UPI002423A740|nr:ImcF-related family protein [Nannocystis sp.]MBK9753419.1 hypothetical protein [Nannocystis sp.]